MSEGVSLRKNHPQTCSDAFSDHHAFCEFIIELNLNKKKGNERFFVGTYFASNTI